jgi:hypothetical protein
MYDDEIQELEGVSTGEILQVARVPEWYWFKVVRNELKTLIYFVNRICDYRDPNEIRRLWNDYLMTPKSINSRVDERCSRQGDWLHPVNK